MSIDFHASAEKRVGFACLHVLCIDVVLSKVIHSENKVMCFPLCSV